MKKKYLTSLLTMALLATGGGNLKAQTVTDGTYYLYDSSSKTFLSRGCAWGTEASMDKYGIPVKVTPTDGAYTLSPADWNGTVYINGSKGVYTDQDSYSWSAEQSGAGYIFYNGSDYMTHANGPLGEYVTKTTDKNAATVWTLMSADDRNAIVNNYPNDNYTNVANSAGLTDVTADNFVTTLEKDYSLVTEKTIEPTAYTWTQVSRTNASSNSPREIYQGTGNFTYSVTGLTQGIYKVTIPAFYRNGANDWCVSKNTDFAINSNAYILANGEQVRIKGWAEERTSETNPNSVDQAKTSFTSGKYSNEVYCYVGSDGKLDITVAYPNYQAAGWGIFGTTTISYYQPTSDAALYYNALAKAKAIDQTSPMNATVLQTLQTDISTYSNVKSEYETATKALTDATDAANTSIAAYTNANTILEQMKKFVDNTNVYTADALKTYYTDPKDKYDKRTLSNEEAYALQNPYTITKWRAANTVDDLLMSVWTANPEEWSTYYVNTWSKEDTNNGFPVPFIEYWIADANTLADKTLTATVTGLKAGQLYKLSALVRVAVSTSKVAPATGITLDVNGESDYAATITGKQIGSTTRYLDTYTVFGKADSNGEIKINFNISNTNVSWLAFQNLTYEEAYALDENATAAPDALTAPVSVIYNRTFKQGWNSIVLPFATTPDELGAEEAVAFTGTEGNTIKFETVTSLEANKPYMIYFAEEKTGVTFTNKTVSPAEDLTTEDTGAQFDFVGSYVANTNPVAGDYIVVTKGLQKAKGGNTMKAFRAYFKARSDEASAKAMTISIDGEAVTGIEAIDFNDALQGNEPSYNLAGQRVAKNYKGIVVRNGKKTINK